ncbi:MAG: gamma-glutamyltransferase family protein [Solirubrobacterales bacterium]
MKGVVAAGHPLTAEAGAKALRAGGNAFDAAVSAVLASFATESPLTGLGAGGFMLAHVEGEGDTLLDFFVEAGGRGLDPGGRRAELVALEVLFDQVPQVFNVGPASCGVPGTAAGLWEAAQRWCSLPFGDLIEPAVQAARDGVRVTPEHAYVFTILEPILTRYPETRALYAPEDRMLTTGDLFRFPDLADALERLATEGPGWLYGGEVGERISDWVHEQGGMLSPEDFAAYEVVERRPVEAAYRGRHVLTNPPPSSGGVLIAFALDLLERLGDPAPFDDPDALQLFLEVMAEAAGARGADFHDRLHEDGFAAGFLSPSSLEHAAASVAERVSSGGRTAGGEPLGSTTHISTLDVDGNAVSVTCSNGTGSGIMTPGTGVHLNNMLGEEDLNPLGFHRLAPGTRVTSMMAPTVVLRDGEVEMSLGSAGSNRLRSAILQVVRYVIDCGMDVTEAVRTGRVHYEADTLHAEPGFSAESLDELERRGYRVVRWKGLNLYFGGAQAARRDSRTGDMSGAGDPRRGGTAVVVD